MPTVRREIPGGIVIAAEPGVYLVQAETEDGAGYYRRVTLAAPAPGPTPPPSPPVPPTPQPEPPPPVPQPQKLTAVVIEESSQRTPAQANVLLSPAVAAYVAAGQHRWYVFDQDAAKAGAVTQCGPGGCRAVPVAKLDPAFAPFFDAARGKQLPRLVIAAQGTGGKILAEIPLPATSAAVLDALKKYGG